MFSVIVPYKNAAAWLPRCIASLLRQSGAMEFLLINDGSTDGSEQIAASYHDKRLRLFDNRHASGVSGARNTGLDYALGEWVTFLDADDELKPSAYFQYKDAIGKTDAGVIQFNSAHKFIGSDMEPVKHYNGEGWRTLDNLPLYWQPVWNKIYKSSTIYGLSFDESLQFGEDEYFNFEVFERTRGVYCSKLVTMLHHHCNAQSLAKLATIEDRKREVEALKAYASRSDTEHAQAILGRLAELKAREEYKGIF